MPSIDWKNNAFSHSSRASAHPTVIGHSHWKSINPGRVRFPRRFRWTFRSRFPEQCIRGPSQRTTKRPKSLNSKTDTVWYRLFLNHTTVAQWCRSEHRESYTHTHEYCLILNGYKKIVFLPLNMSGGRTIS